VNRSINLTKRIKTPNGLRFCTVARSANGRVKANFVLLDGHEEQVPCGADEAREGLRSHCHILGLALCGAV